MKYFNPSYWFKLWVLSAPLFNDKTQGINAKSIDNKKIKDWASKDITSLELINQEISFTNSTSNYQPYNLNQLTNQNINPIYQTELETSTHKHRHEKSRNRDKRGVNGGNEIEYGTSGLGGNFYASFKPEFWEEIVELKLNNNKENFAEKFKNKMYTGVWKDYRIDSEKDMKNLGEGIYDNFSTISNKFIDSNRKERIRIVIYYKKPNEYSNYSQFQNTKIEFKSVNIRTDDSKWYPNKYLDNLEKDLNGEDIKEGTVNLGVVNYISSDTTIEDYIKQSLKNRYPNLDISKFSIVDQTDYSQFCKCYTAKMYMSASKTKYSYGKIKTKFVYTTRHKLNEISTIITNDSKVKQWIQHINEFNYNLPRAINNAKTFSYQHLYNWKRQEKEIIKGYIRDWSYVHTLIENELKLDELNKNVQGLKANFEFIKNQINELDRRVTNLENTSNLNCGNSGWLVSSISASVSTFTEVAKISNAIPVVGNVISAVSALIAASCGIAGV